MSKKFKLVYEKDGIVKGSYDGIPAGKDTELIEKAVLDGSKPVPPAPTPGPDTSLLPDFFFPFMNISEPGADGIEEFLEFIRLPLEQGYEELCVFLADLKFKAKLPLSEETRDQLEDVVIYHAEATSEYSADIYYYSINDISKKHCVTVEIEQDSETGAWVYVFGEIRDEEE